MKFPSSLPMREVAQDSIESIELIRTRQVRVADMVTHRLPLAETGRGFQLTARGQDSIKVIIDPLL